MQTSTRSFSHPTQISLGNGGEFCRNSSPPSASVKAEGATGLKWWLSTFGGWKVVGRLSGSEPLVAEQISLVACKATQDKYSSVVQSLFVVREEKIKFLYRVLFDVVPGSSTTTLGDSPHSQQRLNKTTTWDINALSLELGKACCSPAVLQWIL